MARSKFRLSTKKCGKWTRLEKRLKVSVPHKLAPWLGVRATIDLDMFQKDRWRSCAVTDAEVQQHALMQQIAVVIVAARNMEAGPWTRMARTFLTSRGTAIHENFAFTRDGFTMRMSATNGNAAEFVPVATQPTTAGGTQWPAMHAMARNIRTITLVPE